MRMRWLKAAFVLFAIVGIHTSLSDDLKNIRFTVKKKVESVAPAKIYDKSQGAYVDGQKKRVTNREYIYEVADAKLKGKELAVDEDSAITEYLKKDSGKNPSFDEMASRKVDCREVAMKMVNNLIDYSVLHNVDDNGHLTYVARDQSEKAFIAKQLGYIHIRRAGRNEEPKAECHKLDDAENLTFISSDKISEVKGLVEKQALRSGGKYRERMACPVLEIVVKPMNSKYKASGDEKFEKGKFSVVNVLKCAGEESTKLMSYYACENVALLKACGLEGSLGASLPGGGFAADGLAEELEAAKDRDMTALADGAPIDELVLQNNAEQKADVKVNLPSQTYFDKFDAPKKSDSKK